MCFNYYCVSAVLLLLHLYIMHGIIMEERVIINATIIYGYYLFLRKIIIIIIHKSLKGVN